MEISVDEEHSFVLKSAPQTLGDVLNEVTRYIQAKKRAIQVITLNDVDVPPEDLTPELGQTPISEVETLRVHTISVAELVMSALEEIADVIPELSSACHELAQILSSEDPASCFGQFNQFLDIWEVLKERQSQATNLMELNASDLALKKGSLSLHDATLDRLLGKARNCMETSDFPGLADLLSHDLSELAEVEEEIIELLKSKL